MIRKKYNTINELNIKKAPVVSAVATVLFGVSAGVVHAATDIDSAVTLSTDNSTTSYSLGTNATLNINGSVSQYYGTLDGSDVSSSDNGTLSDSQRGNVTVSNVNSLTLYGNVGATNGTGNFTLEAHSTLYLADNATTFRTTTLTLGTNSTFYTGNNASRGNNRASGDALTMTSNITMRGDSVLNVGNGTTITGNIYGDTDGQGTLNINGNFTSGGAIGSDSVASTTAGELAVINISSGNTLTLNHNASATSIYANGTIKALTDSANMTGAILMGTNGKIYLQNGVNNGGSGNAAKINGAIDGNGARAGSLYINGTWSSGGVIGGTNGLDNIYLDSNNPSTTAQIYTFTHNVNATTITVGSSVTTGDNSVQSKNATLRTNAPSGGAGVQLVITGKIEGSGNSSAAGTLDINTDTTVTGTIGASNNLANIEIADGKSLTVNSAITSDNITFEHTTASSTNATLSLNGTSGTAYTLSGGINGGTQGDGMVDVNSGNWTFSNEIGTTNLISAIRVEEGAWANVSSNIATNETIMINGTLNITGSMSITALDASGYGSGLNIGHGESSSSTNATLQISDDAVLTIGRSSNKGTGALEGDGATFANATIRLKGAGTSSYSSNSTAAINIGSNNQTVTLNEVSIDMIGGNNNTYSDGQVVNIIGRGSNVSHNGTLTVTGSVNVIDGSSMLSFSENSATFKARLDNSTSALQVTVNYVSATTLGLTGNTKATYNGAKTAISLDNAVFSELADMDTNAKVDAAIATLHPATGAAAAASASISSSSMGTASTRMAYTRQTGLGRGMNAGGATLDESTWIQVFGADVDQDNVGGVSGYDADGQGLAIGIDGMSEDGATRIGIAGSFANTDVTGKDSTTKTTTDIDTTQIMAYANKVNDDGSYLEGMASYAFNDNTGTRRILVGSVDRTASSAYDSTTFGINVEAGWPKENDGLTVTPTVGLAYSSTSADAYTETGAGGMNLNVTPTDYETFEGKAGVKITGKSVDADGGVGRPEVRIGVTHNFGDDTADSTATFTAGGSSFTTKGVETDNTKVDLGLGYTYTNPEGDTDVSVNFDGRRSSSYLQYGGGLTVKWKF